MATSTAITDLDKCVSLGLSSSELERLLRSGVDLEQIQAQDINSAINGTDDMNMVQAQQLQQQQQQQQRQLAAKITEPWTEITEQPKQRGLRFRYECEGRSAGSIPGENNVNDKRTFPTIRINNHKGTAVVVVSSVTKDNAPRPHPHALVGKDCAKGVCTIKVKDASKPITFPNLGIQCAKKKEVQDALTQREQIRVDPFQTGFKHKNGNIDLNVVRLCFQVFLPDRNGKYTRIVSPVVSNPIFDKKAVNDLVICRIDKSAGSCCGGDEVFLLCEKVQKEDIQVRFYEEKDDGIIWEKFGDFGQSDVHRQVAIVFKTPAYRDMDIQQPVTVFMQLRRPSDDQTSDPKPFQYMPDDRDPEMIQAKRRRKKVMSNFFTDSTFPATGSASAMNDGFQQRSGSSNVTTEQIRQRLIAKAARQNIKQEVTTPTTTDFSRHPIQDTSGGMSTFNYSSQTHASRGIVTVTTQNQPMETSATTQYQSDAMQVGQPVGVGQQALAPPIQYNYPPIASSQNEMTEPVTFDSGTIKAMLGLDSLEFNSGELMQGMQQSFPETDAVLSMEMSQLDVAAHESVGDDQIANNTVRGTLDDVNQQIRSLNQS